MATIGEAVEMELLDLAADGRGIGRCEGEVVFVAGGLPGDQVRLRLSGRSRGQLQGRIEQILVPSADRRRPPCILADHCGGCTLQALDDGAERSWKQGHLRETLRRIAAIDSTPRPLLACERCLGYRNRAVIPLERRADGRLRAGYYRRGSHRIVNMNRCPVLDPRIDELIGPLKADLEASGWPVNRHAEPGSGGGLRHLALRVGHHTGERLICLVASHGELPGLEAMAENWRRTWPQVVGVCLNVQPQPTNLLLGPHTRTVSGQGWLSERFAGLTYRIAADTFFQINTPQAERVVALLEEALGPPPGQLIDGFCGIGTYSLPLAARGWQVHGIEQQGAAVALARRNAAGNGLEEKVRFEEAPVGAVLAERLAGDGEHSIDALFLDPPRKGLDAACHAAILAAPPARLAYLSCDPATLARDLARLCTNGPYRLSWCQPIDFFPNTSHVETLAALERI